MKRFRFFLFLTVMFLLIGQASAGSYSINGTTYDTTWDGRVIPSSEIVYGSNDDTILQQTLIPATAFTVGNDTIYLNNNFTSFKREKFKVSPILTYPKTTLLNKMISVNSTTAYLTFPYSLSRTKDFISNNEIHMGYWTFKAGQEHINIYDDNLTQNILNKSAYEFRIVNDEIRLYFLKSEANKLQGNITFEMNSWTINGSTTPSWVNTSKNNTFMDICTKGIQLSETIGNYISKWSGNGCSLDQNTTSANDGTLNGGMGYASLSNGKMGFKFDGINDYINIGSNPELDFIYTFSFVIGIKPANRTPSSVPYTVFDHSNDGQQGWRLIDYFGLYSFTLRTGYSATASTDFSSSLIPLKEEHIMGGTWNNTNITILLDGIQKNVGAGTSGGTPVGNLVLGAYTSGINPFNGTMFNVYLFDWALNISEIQLVSNDSRLSSGNLTAWYNAGTGNETFQIDINATTPINTNYTLWYGNNASGTWTQLGGTLTGNNSEIISGTKYQNTDVQVRLAGNTTATPELIQITFFDQAVSGGAGDFIPPSPISLANTTGNFWINHTWQAGSGNVTDSFNVSQNNTWTNGSSVTFMNVSVGAHNWSNISVYAYNSSGNGYLNQTPASMNTQVLNNAPIQSPIGNKSVTAGSWLNFTVSATDADSDTITYSTNASKGTLNTTTGNFNWSTTGADVGNYVWNFNSSDAYGGVDDENITVTVNSAELPSFTHTIFGAWE